jgi:parallel beta-helix repeat protein
MIIFSSLMYFILSFTFLTSSLLSTFVWGTINNNSATINTNNVDPQGNIITSQNTGNSNDNTNPRDQIKEDQSESNSITIRDGDRSNVNDSNSPGVTDLISSPSQRSPQTTTATTEESHPACGQIVQGKVKLNANLICKGDGIIVGGNDTTINLNGYSLKGPGLNSNKVGIMIAGQYNVSVMGNGIISGFQSGIYISGSTKVNLHELSVNNNKVAFYLTGAQQPEISNNMVNNNTIGVALHSSVNAQVDYNQLSLNRLSGVTLINTGESVIHGNNILNTSNGIFLDTQSSSNKVDFNNVFNNILDINNANNLPININDNQYSNNNCQTSLPSGLCIGR